MHVLLYIAHQSGMSEVGGMTVAYRYASNGLRVCRGFLTKPSEDEAGRARTVDRHARRAAMSFIENISYYEAVTGDYSLYPFTVHELYQAGFLALIGPSVH